LRKFEKDEEARKKRELEYRELKLKEDQIELKAR
jgi:hypothetical protein